MRISDYIADFLVKNGIRHCFSVTGGGAMHLNDALGHHEGLTCIYHHHEQACAMAAEAYTRFSGELAVVCVTSGPGGTNAITGVFGGYTDSVPMLILSGQAKRETLATSYPELDLRQLGDQECNIAKMVSGITKYAVTVREPSEMAYHLEKALYLATEGRGGPVWLDIPLDVQGAEVELPFSHHFDPASEFFAPVPTFSGSVAREILTRIHRAAAPLILIGTGVRLSGSIPKLLALLDKLKIPAAVAWNANDALPFDHPSFAGMPGTVGTRAGNFALQNCDLLLSLGCRLNIRMIGYNRFDFAKNAYQIVVDLDENELKKPTVRADMPVWGDVGDVLDALLREPYEIAPRHAPWLAWCQETVRKYPVVLPTYRSTKTTALNPYVFLDTLFSCLTEQDRIVCSNGSACVMTFQAAKIKAGQRMFTNSGCAAMGYGLPAALGVALADRTSRVVCIEGDGSIMMNLQELATLAHNQLNVKILLLNNDGYHSIRQTQQNLFGGRFVGLDAKSGIAFPDFSLIAEAFGIDYARIEGELSQKQLTEALDGPCARLIEVVVDKTQDFAPKCSAKRLPNGRLVSPSLDDMAPFLSREEYSAIRYQKQ